MKFYNHILLLTLLLISFSWAQEQPSFLTGPGLLVTMASHSNLGQGGSLHFDATIPSETYKGLHWGFRSFFSASSFNDYVNTQLDDNTDDLDRDFYAGGIVLGPVFKTEGSSYLTGSAGLLMAANYAVDITYGASDRVDRRVLSETSDLSFGAEGVIGYGLRFKSGFIMEMSLFIQGASSENAPGVLFSAGPKWTFGVNL
jgi:hypothetical protein